MEERYEKQQAGEIVVQNRFVKWLDNFWYHYKWHTIAALFFIFVFAVCFVQCSSSQGGAAIRIAYVGGYDPIPISQGEVKAALTTNEKKEIIKVFETISPVSTLEKPVDFVTYDVYSPEQIKSIAWDSTAGQVNTILSDNIQRTSASNFNQFLTYNKTGDSAVWLVSEYVYTERGLDKTGIRPLSDFYGTLPESAYDEYAIRLSETDLYQTFDALQLLPEDTLIVMPKKMVWGSSSEEDTYAIFEAMFRAIVDFKAPGTEG